VVTDHVLIVDDEEGIRVVLKRWIEALGYKTREADSAEAGLEAMKADVSAVVFCDVQMPGQGGLWLAGVLRAQFPHSAIILATGVTTVPPTTTLRPGIIAYLTKPFSAPDVRTALEGAMVWHDAAVASGAPASRTDDPDAGLQAWLDSLE
jgi:DNA-binding NtrC family response regulator